MVLKKLDNIFGVVNYIPSSYLIKLRDVRELNFRYKFLGFNGES